MQMTYRFNAIYPSWLLKSTPMCFHFVFCLVWLLFSNFYRVSIWLSFVVAVKSDRVCAREPLPSHVPPPFKPTSLIPLYFFVFIYRSNSVFVFVFACAITKNGPQFLVFTSSSSSSTKSMFSLISKELHHSTPSSPQFSNFLFDHFFSRGGGGLSLIIIDLHHLVFLSMVTMLPTHC